MLFLTYAFSAGQKLPLNLGFPEVECLVQLAKVEDEVCPIIGSVDHQPQPPTPPNPQNYLIILSLQKVGTYTIYLGLRLGV